ncbi:GAP family protein [Actinotalea sp. C106]|uniref:GAP family protein n=1 Tax=Actinotalea sp. C106 TaxID=2908644 RepID=UPI002029068B|nr:GAP family protein [Actinotalea sp. C106]
MTFELLGPLAVLALIDSTSFGTLLIPLWLMLAPTGLRPGRVLAFLGTVAAFYLAVGVALLAGADAVLDGAQGVLETPGGSVAQLVIGAGLLVWSFFIGRKPAGGKAAGGEAASGPGRLMRWRERAMSGQGGGGALLALALGAAAAEVATMLPYLGAIGLLSTSGLGVVEQVGVLAAYCVVMVLPALVLLLARLVARRLVEAPLLRLQGWMERTGAETTAWVVGIVGFLLARDALGRLPDVGNLLGGLGG